MTSSETTRYRENVAAVIVNSEGLLLACERSDVSGAWQLPQGGVNPGEQLQQAFFRELREEIGTDDVEVLHKLNSPICYSWPQPKRYEGIVYKGQRQHYFLARLQNLDAIDLCACSDPEFSSYCWMKISRFVGLVSGFKSAAYRQALDQFLKLYPELFLK